MGFCLITFLVNGQEGKVKIFQSRRMQFMSNKIVDLSYGNLKEVPVLHATDEIEILILDNNNLERLPSWIGTLKNLRVLSVRNNNLTELNDHQI
jgi:Leucine-rich repeat (LRR) protein